jgi:hypothetical protein
MGKGKVILAIVASAVIGFIQWRWVLANGWMYIAAYNPLPHWLIVHGVRGNGFRTVFFIHDTIINVILCLPAALALRRLRPHKPLTYPTVAALTGFIWEYRMLFEHPAIPSLNDGVFVYGMILTLVILPIASIVLDLLNRHARDGHNTSSLR